ncbi:MAG: NHL repeat-containing protein [Acidobacteriota bacterium]|nr:NHL repeat-containing protein [Acidobacteriota bacterium]
MPLHAALAWFRHSLLRSSFALLVTGMLAGCGGAGSTGSSGSTGTPTPTLIALSGVVNSGSQTVAAASVQLYAAGLTGNGSTATALLATPAQTDSSGHFTTSSAYTCPADSAPVYMVASGGSVGSASGSANAGLVMVTALGSCAGLTASTAITVNEVTTAAAAWALAPFAQSATRLGAAATNLTGLSNAFATAAILADSGSGTSPAAAAPANATINSAKIYALANVLASCVNSTGAAPCTALFAAATPPAGTAPADTFQAALSIVRNPGNNVGALFALAPAPAVFAAGLATPPPDWTLATRYTGGGLNSPTGVAVDASGNLWVSNYYGSVSVLSPAGKPLTSTGYTAGGLSDVYGIALDSAGNAWMPDEYSTALVNNGLGAVTALNSAGQSISGASGFGLSQFDHPVAVATDTNGTIWVANNGSSTVSLINTTGTAVSAAPGFGQGSLGSPISIAVDSRHNAWVGQSGTSVYSVSPTGTTVTPHPCCNDSAGIAIDSSDNVWVANYLGNTLSLLSTSASGVGYPTYTGGGLSYPQGIAVDSAGTVWVANLHGNSISEFAGASATQRGAALSPNAGWGPDANLHQGYAVAIDASGSLWIPEFTNKSITQFVGLAAPVKSPRVGPAQAP